MTTPNELEQAPAITIDFDVAAKMRDGTVLRANVYRPAGEGRWPVLLRRTPYSKDAPDAFDVEAARRGYVVITQDTRGRFKSEGEWYPYRSEAEDGFDTIAWAAALPYVDGQVGLIGGSYHGFTQWAAATLQPPALKAMMPEVTWADPLKLFIYRGGAFRLGVAYYYLNLGFDVLVRRYRHDPAAHDEAVRALRREIDDLEPAGYRSLPLAHFAPVRRHDVGSVFFDELAAPLDRDHPAWEPMTIVGKHERVQVPTCNIGGWYDPFIGDTLLHYQAMRAQGRPTKLLIGPWTHGSTTPRVGELNFGIGSPRGSIDLKTSLGSLRLRWFDHWLKGIDTGIMAEPPIKLFVMGANVWRDEAEWPLARAVETPFYLRQGGQLNVEQPGAEEPDRYDYDPSDPVPNLAGAFAMAPEYPHGPFDQRPIEARPDVLLYRTLPLERDTEVTGPIEVRLWAASSAPDTDFVARLVDVYPDGRSINLNEGIVRARYREFDRGEPPSLIEPGRPYEYAIDLFATSNVFKAGHRIGLQVTSSDFPRWDRNPNTGHAFGADAELRVAHQEILHDHAHPSHVRLPLIPILR
jgi:putative CocE/NonD family hydrolase